MVVRRFPDNSELYHHGIKGQRWGIRRYQNPDGSLTSAGKDRYVKNERNQKLKERRTLSDDELRSRIQRLKLEHEYKRLSEEDIKPGKKFCDEFLKNFGRTVLTSVATGSTLYAINGMLTREFDPHKAANYIAPPPKKK